MQNPTDGRPTRPRRQRHRFPAHVQKQANEVCRRPLGNWNAIFGVFEVWGRIAATIILFYLLLPTYGWWPTYVGCVVAMGCWQRALATLLHESAHKRLAENKVVNFVCGTFCSGYLIFQGWIAYEDSHGGHHLYLGDEAKDVDLKFQVKQGTYEKQSVAAFAWNFLISPLVLLKTPAKIVDLVRYRFLSKEEPLPEKLGKIGYAALVFGTLITLGYGYELLLFWLTPLLLTFPIVNWYVELFEHFPHVVENNKDLHMTRNRWTGLLGKLFLGVLNENYHQTHHLFPHCAYWRLPELHLVLMQDPEYRETQFREVGLLFPVITGVPSIILLILNYIREGGNSSEMWKSNAA